MLRSVQTGRSLMTNFRIPCITTGPPCPSSLGLINTESTDRMNSLTFPLCFKVLLSFIHRTLIPLRSKKADHAHRNEARKLTGAAADCLSLFSSSRCFLPWFAVLFARASIFPFRSCSPLQRFDVSSLAAFVEGNEKLGVEPKGGNVNCRGPIR